MPIGSYSTHRIFPTKKLVKVPNEIELENVVTLMTKGFTVFYLLHKTYPVKSGETILFHAAAGGVGQIFAQWANSIGAKVIGTVGSDEKIKIAQENGYSHVINYSKNDFAKEVMKITDNRGVSSVFDGVGKKTFYGSLACLKTRGISLFLFFKPLLPFLAGIIANIKNLFFLILGNYSLHLFETNVMDLPAMYLEEKPTKVNPWCQTCE